MSDIDNLYDEGVYETPAETSSQENNRESRLKQGCWPIAAQEQIMVLIENGFKVATVEECHEKYADVFFMKPLNP